MGGSPSHPPAAHELGHGHSPARPYARLRLLLGPERRDLVAVVVFAVAVAVLSLAAPIAVESLVNTVAFGVLLWPVIVLALILAGCLGLAAAIRAMQVYVIECLQRRLFVRVTADYAHRLPRIRLDAFDRRYGPELANRFFDVLNVQKALATLLLDGVALVVTTVVGLTVVAFYHPVLLGFDAVLILLVLFLVFGLGWGGVRTALRESHAKYDVAAWLQELLHRHRAIKLAGGPRLAAAVGDRLAAEYLSARRAHFRVVWRQTLFALGLQVVGGTALLGLGGYLVVHQQLTLGQLVASELIVSVVLGSVAKLGKYAETYYDLLAGSEKLGLLTDLPLERDGGEAPPPGGALAVRLRGVDRVSGRRLPIPADWAVAAGERVAVVGPPGAGKTLLFETIAGLREPDHGVVELDGLDVRVFDPDKLREEVELVGGAEVFIGTVNDNLRVGRADLSAAAVRDALRAVGLLEVVQALPQGFDTVLTPNGGPLSAAQAVRLTLARAIAARPRLLLLDCTLDAADDSADLLPALFDRAAPWTLLVATTSPAVVGRCDRIIPLAATTPEAHA